MTVKDFKIWLIKNDHTQITLAKRLGLSPNTITNYVSSKSFPIVFVLALKGLEK